MHVSRYEEQVREKTNAIQKEDLSDMVAEHAAKQKVGFQSGRVYGRIIFLACFLQKRKRAGGDSAGGKAAKKLKEFKF